MKIAILGHCGSGKSTLARQLGEKYDLPVLHFDAIHFLPGWVETDRPYKREKVNAFLDENPEGWVMDGNYFKICAERRFAEADHIIYLDFPRRLCLPRVLKRWIHYRGKTRPDMGPGCEEPIEKVAYKPLRGASPLAVLITAIGVSYLLQSLAQIILTRPSWLRPFSSLAR